MTLKQRMKLWFLLGWVAFVVLVVIALFVVAEINRASP